MPRSIESLLASRRVTVMGLGLFGGGAGAARFFAVRGAEVTVTDLSGAEKLARSVESLREFPVRFVLGEHVREDFTGADLVVANQAVRPDNPFLEAARGAGVPVATETGLALALCGSPFVAVTGSNGKSTTASLAAAVLARHDPRALFGGNIGGDLLTRVSGHPPAAPATVELSSFQLVHIGPLFASGEVPPPKVAVVTNLSPNHLDWHGDLAEYYGAKKALLLHQDPGGWAVLNRGDAESWRWAADCPARVVACGLDDPGGENACFRSGGNLVLRLAGREELSLPLSLLRPPGEHNVMNALQAVAASYVFCRDPAAVREGLGSFGGLEHRLEFVLEKNGRRFVNDSKCTTPGAAILALRSVPGPLSLIAGGYDKRADFGDLAGEIQRRVSFLALVGATAGRIGDAAAAAAHLRPPGLPPLRTANCGGDFELAAREAYLACPDGGAVLLSPACASWDMFDNFESRGRRFKEIAAAL